MIELRALTIGFPKNDGSTAIAVRDLDLSVARGDRIGIVGESGSGKSLTALACLGLVPEPGRILGGEILIAGEALESVSESRLQELRGGRIGITFQEASNAFNPVYTVGFQLQEVLRVHRGVDRIEGRDLGRELLEMVAIDEPERVFSAYPHQLSGGQAQRAMLALALAGTPRLLIADEPTSSLDLVTKIEILDLVRRLVEHGELGLLFISHDLKMVRHAVDRLIVMYEGEIVEEGPSDIVFGDPLHPYTAMLLGLGIDDGRRARASESSPKPGSSSVHSEGCRFTSRCPHGRDSCLHTQPELIELPGDRKLRCPVVAAGEESCRVEH